MAGKIKTMIDAIIDQRGKGIETLIATTKTKLILKGIKLDNYDANSEDDLGVVEKLREIANDLNVAIN
ncbi:MAG: hypothetical protein U9P49_02305 [Thermodesulfobacteriota bacterium]|nr:hypothetical protein [Thermodesulfobacteriota bacterium]